MQSNQIVIFLYHSNLDTLNCTQYTLSLDNIDTSLDNINTS